MKVLLLGATALLLLGGCRPGTSDDRKPLPAERGLVWHACDSDVEVAFTTEHRCGTLTVPVDHDVPTGPSLELAVVEASPPQEVDRAEVAVSVGFNFGDPMHPPGSLPPLAERFAVPVVALAPRGVGARGGVSLDCPEVTGLGSTLVGLSDAEGHLRLLDGVASCHERLVAEGVDLDLFGVDDIARDVESLRAALSVDRWYAMISYGEMSRVIDALSALHPGRARVVVEDSPLPWHLDSFAAAAEGTRSALADLFAECRDDPGCARAYPRLEATWRTALDRASADPLSGRSTVGTVRVDAAKLQRSVRGMLSGDGPTFVADLPRVISTAAEGRVHPVLAEALANDPDLCLGHRPICPQPGFSLGAYLSQRCPELGTAGGDGDGRALAEDPYTRACTTWDVDPVPPAPGPASPRLVLTGDLDSWSRPEWFDGAVRVRGATHDVSGSSSCVHQVRNPWVADPSAPPDPRACEDAPFPEWD